MQDMLQLIHKAIEKGYRIAVTGPHGIGKTQAITHLVKTELPQFKPVYISLAGMAKDDLMTPFPVEIEGERFVQYLHHIIFDDRTPEGHKPIVLVVDEFNRNITDQQIYNALLEVMSINTLGGRSINLQSFVALMNPTNDKRYFNTVPLEVTVQDRFHLYLKVDGYDLGADRYLLAKYPSTAPAMIEWYLSLPSGKRGLIPPRRQDYVLQAYQDGFPIELAFPEDTTLPVGMLTDLIEKGEAWTLSKLLAHPKDAVKVINTKPELVPLFYALLLGVQDKGQAERLLPVALALPEHVRISLAQKPNSVWLLVYAEQSKQKGAKGNG